MSLTVIRPFRWYSLSTTRSFSILCLCRIDLASWSVVPTGTVTRSSFVITAETGRSVRVSNRRSRFVKMPSRRPPRSVTGTPEILNRCISSSASAIFCSGPMVTGSTIMPLSERFTLSTSAACASIGRFLCTMPMPPCWAMAIARRESVTVSMAAETRGMLSRMLRVSWVVTSTRLGTTSERAGSRSTSSKVSASGIAPSSICVGTSGRGAAPSIVLDPRSMRGRGPGRSPAPLFRTVALLVFLSRAAGTGIVPAHAGAGALRRLGRLFRRGAVRQVPLAAGAHLLLLGRHRGVHAPQVHDDLVFDPLLHQPEHDEGFLLVLGQRVALAVTPQADPLLEVVHRQQVVLPGGVDDIEHEGALVLAHGGPTHGALLLFIARLDLRPETLAQLRGAHLRPVDPESLHVETEVPQKTVPQLVGLPVLGVRVGPAGRVEEVVQDLLGLLQQVFLLALPFEQLAAQAVDFRALLVVDVVVLQEVLADLEVARLDLLLGSLDRAGHHAVLDRDPLLHAEALHQAGDAVRPEDAHQVVLEGHVETGRARVALAPGAAAQLVVDAPRLVPLGAQDVQPPDRHDLVVLGDAARLVALHPLLPLLGRHGRRVDPLLPDLPARQELGVAPEQDVGAAPGHVGGDGHRLEPPGLRDDLGLLLVVLGVQDDMRDPSLLEELAQVFRLLDGDGADQDRLPFLVQVLNLLDDGVELLPLRAVHHVRVLDADERPVRGGDHDLESVDLVELDGLRVGGPGHAGELAVHPEVILEGDGREGLVLLLDLDLLLGLDRLVQAVEAKEKVKVQKENQTLAT